MERARLGPAGPLVSIEDFIRKVSANPDRATHEPYCPSCDRRLHIYGRNSVAVRSRFDHPDGSQDCPLSNSPDRRFAHLVPRDWDFESGHRIRAAFLGDDNLRLAFNFCHKLAGRGALSAAKFGELIHLADAKKVWCYRGIPLWALPYILLTLDDFETSNGDSVQYRFRFVIQKPPRGNIDDLWIKPEDCRLAKVFEDGRMMDRVPGNPFPVSEQALCELAGDSTWIKDRLINALRNASRR